jgi:hypothetical protein
MESSVLNFLKNQTRGHQMTIKKQKISTYEIAINEKPKQASTND